LKELVTIARVAGDRTAPPKPWSARADQQTAGVGERAHQRGDREQGGAGEEHTSAPQQVGAAASEHEEAGEGEGVGVDNPLQAGGGEPEAIVDGGEGDVYDGHVEDDHELRQADGGQDSLASESHRPRLGGR
jgi:hypothetical protein